ncbi:MAG: ABC transporter permease [Clostridia bacterium]|nr:ABC transporter permease [Clostridia bacterium]
MTWSEFYAKNYVSYEDENIKLHVDDEKGTYRVVDYTDSDAPETLASGRYTASENGLRMEEGMTSFTSAVSYSEASLWNKFTAVLSGYFSWLGNMLRGDMGESFIFQKPVNQVIGENMWISFFISFVAMILQFAIAIPMGITSATHQYSVRDYTVTVVTMIGISLPSFFFAALLIKIFSSWLGWFPASGLVSGSSSAEGLAHILDMLHHLVLPMVVLVVLSIGGLMRYTRTNMLEVLNSDYIRTARAKGLSEKKVIYVHAFRNTMIPLMTMMAGILPSLFGGAMITEEVFSIDGIGRLAYKALQQGDVPFIMGYNMFLAVLTVIGTLFSDLMYAVVDPRVKLTK